MSSQNLEDNNLINNEDILENFLKITKNKANFDKLPIQKETLDFQLFIFKNLKNLLIEYKNNLNSEELLFLKNFVKYKPCKVLMCDKNVGLSLMSNVCYDVLSINHLKNKSVYKKFIV